MSGMFIDNAKIKAKRQITIPKDADDAVDVKTGDRKTFIADDDSVRMVNSAIYAMQVFQSEMKGAKEKAGIYTDDDIMDMVRELRSADQK